MSFYTQRKSPFFHSPLAVFPKIYCIRYEMCVVHFVCCFKKLSTLQEIEWKVSDVTHYANSSLPRVCKLLFSPQVTHVGLLKHKKIKLNLRNAQAVVNLGFSAFLTSSSSSFFFHPLSIKPLRGKNF